MTNENSTQSVALTVLTEDDVKRKIYTIRGEMVMLDSDLAFFYGVETKRINEAVKRNPNRFPKDFVFQLTKEEWDSLRSQNATLITDSISTDYNESTRSRSQNATLNKGRGQNLKYLPYAFTEPGVGQLSSVLKSSTADVVSVRIQRAFVAMRRFINQNAGLFQRFVKHLHNTTPNIQPSKQPSTLSNAPTTAG